MVGWCWFQFLLLVRLQEETTRIQEMHGYYFVMQTIVVEAKVVMLPYPSEKKQFIKKEKSQF